MSNYYLFLDESKPNGGNIPHLCLGGVIYEEEIYKKVRKEVQDIKKEIFNTTEIVLHENDIRRATSGDYRVMRIREKRELYWKKIRTVLSNYEFTVLGSAVNEYQYKNYYDFENVNNPYYIVLQIIMENFVHFLESRDSTGYIYIESTNPVEDTKLRNYYHQIVSNGSLFINKDSYQSRLQGINFMIKEEKNSGIELADMIPGALNRKINSLSPKQPSILDLIEDNIYDGNCTLIDRFGFKVMP